MRADIGIKDHLFDRLKLVAQSRSVTVDAIVEEALNAYLHDKSKTAAGYRELPVSQSLKFADPSVAAMSLGKLLAMAEDEQPERPRQ